MMDPQIDPKYLKLIRIWPQNVAYIIYKDAHMGEVW